MNKARIEELVRSCMGIVVEDLVKSSAVRNAMGDPKFIQGFRDGRDGRPKGDSSEPYQVGYQEGVTTAAIRGGHAANGRRCVMEKCDTPRMNAAVEDEQRGHPKGNRVFEVGCTLERELAEKEREIAELRRERDAALNAHRSICWERQRARDRADKAEADAAALRIDLAERQAKNDRLMLEYCPDEMTQEQIAEWERNQRAAPEPGDCIVTDSARQA